MCYMIKLTSKEEFKVLIDKVENETDLTKHEAKEMLEQSYTLDNNEPNTRKAIRSIEEKG